MSKHYPRTIVPHTLACRMHPEDLAAAYEMRIPLDGCVVTPECERPKPETFFVRKPAADRKRGRIYFRTAVDGRIKDLSTRCDEGDFEGAAAWLLKRRVRLAKNARARLAPESIELAEILDEYLDIAGGMRDREEIKPTSYETYCKSIARLNAGFGDATLADVYADGASRHMDWCRGNGLAQNTAVGDNTTLKVAINSVMKKRGSPYRVDWKVGAQKPRAKAPFEPWEIDAILATIEDGVRRGPDGRPLMEYDPESKERVCLRVSERVLRSFYPFRVGVRFSLDSGTRSEAACEVTYTDPTGPFLDLDSGVLNRRGEMTEDTARKRRGSCLMSPTFMEWLRPIAECALDRGETHVITTWVGRPLKRLNTKVWRKLLDAAGVRYRCVHALKDTAVQIARREGISLNDAAERFCTTPKTLMNFYGADWDIANQVDPAEAMGNQLRWRATSAAVAARLERSTAARRERPLPVRKATVGGNRGGGRRKKWVDKALSVPAVPGERRRRGRPGWREIAARTARGAAVKEGNL